MSLNVHVFIATNKGLVAIQSLTDLQDNVLQSVITINGSTDLATISPSYHRFVQKSTGLIQSEFGVASFRANISRNIDVGSSWQLPFYLAHFIQANSILHNTDVGQIQSDAVKLGHGNPRSGDVVLIATGQINTSSSVIEAVSHIPEKCITASAQIKLWMKKGILVEFFIPASGAQMSDLQQKTEHQKTHEFEHTKSLQYTLLPEVDCAIYPVIDTVQLREHVSRLLPSTEMFEKQSKAGGAISPFATELGKTTQHSTSLFTNTNTKLTEPSVSLNQLSAVMKSTKNDLKSSSTALTQPPSIASTLFSSKLKIALILLFLGMAVAATYSIMMVSFVYPETRFVTKTKSGLHCDANAVQQSINVAEQYVSRIPSTTFSSACSMTLITARKIPQVWLVADSKTLIELSFTAIGDELHWTVPLPQQQQVDREYVLIVTQHSLDLADLSAFKSYLSRLEQTQKPTVEILAMFFSQISVNPQYVSHKMIASRN